MKYFVLLLFILTGTLLPQQKTVLSRDAKTPVEGLSIRSDSVSTVTNKEGIFNFSLFSPGDTLLFSHIAYGIRSFSYSEIARRDTLLLESRILRQPYVEIYGNHPEKELSLTEEISISDEIERTALSVGDILQQHTSLFVKDYGSGLQIVSSRGMSSENTLVLFNEARVNDLRTGMFDFSLLSPSVIDNIAFAQSTDFESGYTSAGGIVKISTANTEQIKKGELGLKAGSNGLRTLNGGIRWSLDEYRMSFRFDRSYASNNYDFIFDNNEYKRRNAHFSKLFLSADLSRITADNTTQIYMHHSLMENGIPGFVVTNNTFSSRAINKTISRLLILNNDTKIGSDFLLSATTAYHQQSLTLYDPDDMLIFEQQESESLLRDIHTSLQLRWNRKNILLSGSYEFGYADLTDMPAYIANDRGIDFMKRRRHALRSSALMHREISFPLIRKITFGGLLTYEINEEQIVEKEVSENISYALSFKADLNLPGTVLKGSWSSSYRYPTFNERYFSTLIYPEPLKPEKYSAFDFGIQTTFQLFGSSAFSLHYYFIDGSNKILWVPSRLALQIPRNIGKVQSQGLEAAFHKSLFGEMLSFSLRYVYTDALNKNAFSEKDNSYNKQLVYTPVHRGTVFLKFFVEPFSFSLSGIFTGESYYTADNDPYNKLDAYFISDASLNYILSTGNFSHSVTLAVYNLLNTEYQIIQSYPMPLRSYSLTYEVTIQ